MYNEDYEKWVNRTDKVFLLALGIVIIIGIILFLSNVSAPEQTKQQAQKELCIIENSLKFPTASNYTINRLCYLEELGRSLAK